ncbi:hypothetical protein H8959_012966 [Pygathrix nigripes]
MDEPLSAAKTERSGEQERGKPLSVQAAGLSHFCEELEEVIAIDVCHTGRQQREEAGGASDHRLPRTESRGLLCPQHTLILLPRHPQSHNDLETNTPEMKVKCGVGETGERDEDFVF